MLCTITLPKNQANLLTFSHFFQTFYQWQLKYSHENSSPWSPCNLGTKSRCWISLFIGNLLSFTQKLKSYKCTQKKHTHYGSESLQKCITVGSFTCAEFLYFLKYIINTNTWKLKRSPIGDIIDHNDICILGCLLYLKITFNIKWDISFSKCVDLFKIWDLQVLSWVGEKSIQNFSFFSILCKTFITFYECNFFWRLFLIRKQRLNSFSKQFIIHNISSVYN